MFEILLFFAVDGIGQGHLFDKEPRRDMIEEKWVGQYRVDAAVAVFRMEALGFTLPKLTWKDRPLKIKITCNYEEA